MVELLDIPPAPRVLAGHLLSFVPQEIWMLVASYLHSVPDFIALCSLSPLAMDAVKVQPKYPQLGGCRVLRALPSMVPDNKMDHDREGSNPRLWEAEFEVAHDGQPESFTMHVSPGGGGIQGKVIFRVQPEYYVWGMKYNVKVPV
jgi:hypothetical protein